MRRVRRSPSEHPGADTDIQRDAGAMQWPSGALGPRQRLDPPNCFADGEALAVLRARAPVSSTAGRCAAARTAGRASTHGYRRHDASVFLYGVRSERSTRCEVASNLKGTSQAPWSILLPQRLSVLRAAKRVERVGGDAGAILGPRVVPPEELCLMRREPFRRGRVLRSQAAHKK